MTCGVIHRLIIASCIPPLGFFSQVGLSQDFWISLVIYPFAVNGLHFRRVASRCDSRPVCHPDSQINRVSAIWF